MTTVATEKPTRRLWLVVFTEAEGSPWWTRMLKRGYRHVSAASWYADQKRWVHVNPTARGLHVELYGEEEFDGRLGQLVEGATLILRFPSRTARLAMPGMTWFCVGTISALLGVRCALSPRALARHLLRNGAEIVEIPHGQPVRSAEAAERRPEGESLAGGGAGAV